MFFPIQIVSDPLRLGEVVRQMGGRVTVQGIELTRAVKIIRRDGTIKLWDWGQCIRKIIALNRSGGMGTTEVDQ